MNIHDVNQGIRKYKNRKRIGRGPGSGHGKTSGRGHKGQGQISGWKQSVVFESGSSSPLVRRIPKRGFNNQWAREVFAVNLGSIEKLFETGEEVTIATLKAKGLANGRFDFLKILSQGNLTKKLKFYAHKYSAAAREKISQAGGEIVELPGPAPVVKNKQKS
ncbi:MAG: 50S ribosomal protein L15 [Pirellulales bacterium]|nr:50S ribosomal protein L15 [Pirellulales bacterium]